MIEPVKHVADLSAYQLAQMDVPDGVPLVSLAQNESLRPPSPRVSQAVSRILGSAQLYPDPEWTQLREMLSTLHGVPSECILCGNGSMELIGALAHCFADENNSVLAPQHAYPFFRTAAVLARARFDQASEVALNVSVDNLLAAVRSDTRLVFFANPGNPTGTRISRAEVLRLRQGLPKNVLLVIDEAYGEYTDHLSEPLFDLVENGDTVILRSFSKAYGLAGMRVGWGAFPTDIAQQLRKVMNPNNLSLAGQAAACAALTDQQYMKETCRMTARIRDKFITRLQRAGLNVQNSFTNFALVEFENIKTARYLTEVFQKKGIVLRAQNGAGLPHCLRATVGTDDEMNKVADILETFATGDLS